jgi:hypothetical protein
MAALAATFGLTRQDSLDFLAYVSLRRPILTLGKRPRRAQSSTVETGTWSSRATSRPLRTSSAVTRLGRATMASRQRRRAAAGHARSSGGAPGVHTFVTPPPSRPSCRPKSAMWSWKLNSSTGRTPRHREAGASRRARKGSQVGRCRPTSACLSAPAQRGIGREARQLPPRASPPFEIASVGLQPWRVLAGFGTRSCPTSEGLARRRTGSADADFIETVTEELDCDAGYGLIAVISDCLQRGHHRLGPGSFSLGDPLRTLLFGRVRASVAARYCLMTASGQKRPARFSPLLGLRASSLCRT